MYHVILSDTQAIDGNLQPSDFAPPDFTVRALPKQQQRSGGMSQTIIINGKVIKDETTDRQYSVRFPFALTPKKAGALVIALPKINWKTLPASGEDGVQLSPDGSVTIHVVPPDKQDDVLLDITANRQKLYPMQPLEITLTVQIKELPGRYNDKNPLDLLKEPPRLRIPWFDNSPPLKGLTPAVPLETLLGSYFVKSGRGFAINDFSGTSTSLGFDDDFFSRPFGMNPFQKVLYQFSDKAKKIKHLDTNGQEKIYWQYQFKRLFMPTATGNYTFGPVSLKGLIPVNSKGLANDTADEVTGKVIFAVAKELTVSVVDVPAENRPLDYIGAFGKFRMDVNVEPKKAKIGEPLTMTVTLTGQGSTENIKAPDLATTGIQDIFRVHLPPTEEQADNSCTFTYTIRPQKSGQIVFPALSASVFDVDAEQFVRLESVPIPLDVTEAETVQSATVYGDISGSSETEQNRKTVQQIKSTAIKISTYTAIGVGGLFALFVLWKIIAVLALRIKQRRNNRRNTALRRAKQQLAAAKSLTSPMECAKALQSVFFGYIADKTDGIAEGMTTADAVTKLQELHVAGATITAIRQFLEGLDTVQYASRRNADLNALKDEAERLLRCVNV
ncbi:hypothetical protein FACS1894170_03940 [Planctomycetales bacterium]|nr:hypothetical protein FACS1894170_03940 [Planctomycetales bacterium]